MGNSDSSHTGIDLDVICIEELLERDEGAPEKFQGSIRSDPKDYRVYLNGIIKRMQGRGGVFNLFPNRSTTLIKY